MGDSNPNADEIIAGHYEEVRLIDVHIGTDGEDIWIGTIGNLAKAEEPAQYVWSRRLMRTAEFLAVLFRVCPIGQTITFSGEGKTIAIKVEDVTKVIEAEKKKVVKPGMIQSKKILDQHGKKRG